MKKILILILFLALNLRAQQIINCVVTVTNTAGTTNGETITVNGTQRLWTNNPSWQMYQIQSGTNILLASSNLWVSYITAPQSGANFSWNGSNALSFSAFPNYPLTVAISSGWATLSLSTNLMTNMTVVRIPPSGVGNYELTNVINGLYAYFTDPANTNVFPTNTPVLKLFVPVDPNIIFLSLSNYTLLMSENGTNFAYQIGLHATNYTDGLGVLFTNLQNSLGTAAYDPQEQFQPANAILSNLVAVAFNPAGASYLDGANNIILQDTNSLIRFEADYGGYTFVNFDNGNHFLVADTAFDIFLRDNNGYDRVAIYDPSTYNGKTVIRSYTGNDGLTVGGQADSISTYNPISFSDNGNTLPATCIGTATNFLSTVQNSGTSETALNQWTIPANTFTNIGDTITETVGLSFSASGSYEVKLYIFGDTVFDQTFTVASTGTMSITAVVSVDSVNSFRSNIWEVGGGLSVDYASQQSSGGSIDFTSSQAVKVGVIAPATGDASVLMQNFQLAPSPTWAGFR